MKKTLVIICALLSALSSCKVDCIQPGVGIELSNFDSSSISVIILKTYSKNSNFSQFIDSTVCSNSAVFQFNYTSDTQYVSEYSDSVLHAVLSIASNVDYILELPLIGRSYKISDITFGAGHQVSYGNIESQCYVKTHYFLNGIAASVAAPFPDKSGTSPQTAYIPILP